MEEKKLYAIVDIAKELGVAESTLRSHAATGELKAEKVGGAWIATKDNIEEYRKTHSLPIKRGRRKRPS